MAAVLVGRLYGSCFTKQAVWQLFWWAGCMIPLQTNAFLIQVILLIRFGLKFFLFGMLNTSGWVRWDLASFFCGSRLTKWNPFNFVITTFPGHETHWRVFWLPAIVIIHQLRIKLMRFRMVFLAAADLVFTPARTSSTALARRYTFDGSLINLSGLYERDSDEDGGEIREAKIWTNPPQTKKEKQALPYLPYFFY